jgi:hypothetical protein
MNFDHLVLVLMVWKGVGSNNMPFLFFPSRSRTTASCAKRIYGSTEIQLSNVSFPPGAIRP